MNPSRRRIIYTLARIAIEQARDYIRDRVWRWKVVHD